MSPLIRLPKLVALVGAFCAVVGAANADTLKLTSGTYANGGNGGAYTVTFTGPGLSGPIDNSSYSPLAALSTTTFETFCLEPTEFFNSGSVYNYTVAKFAFGGGVDNHESAPAAAGDLLSQGTSWLYTQYATGALGAATYNAATRKAENLLLQKAFWYLEDDLNLTSPLLNPYLSLVAAQFGGSLETARANAAANAYNVYALNLTSGSGNTLKQHQSQLYYHVPPRVPDVGATAGLLGLGLAILAATRRRLASRN